MLRFYNLPGRIIAEWEFLFPKRGQLWASRRRRESPLAHLIFSTGFYAAVLVAILAIAILWASPPPRQAANAAPLEAPAPAAIPSTSPVAAEPQAQTLPVAAPARPEVQATDTASGAADDANSSDAERNWSAAETRALFDPLSSQKVKDAIHEALVTGQTQRWEDWGFSGYAVPGAPDVRGCRMVRYSVDQLAQSDAPTITACHTGAPPR